MPPSSSSSLALWLSLGAIILLQSISGTNTTFPAYSSELKTAFSMSQVQLNNLAFASDAGKLLGWFSGIAALHLPLRIVLISGCLLGYIGYGFQFLFLTNQLPSPSYWQIFVLNVISGNSICWINTVCYALCIKNFRSHEQVAVGIATSYQGLSAKIYTDIVFAAYDSSPHSRAKGYLLLNSILPLAVGLLVVPLIRDDNVNVNATGRPRNMTIGFVSMFVITSATGIYAVITSAVGASSIICTSIFLLLPMMVPIVEKSSDAILAKWGINRESIPENEAVNREGGQEDTHDDQSGIIPELGVTLMVKRVEFWLYFFVYMFSATLGLVFLNNLGQIAESRGSGTSSLVSLASAFGFFGRLFPSMLHYFFTGRMIATPALILAWMAPVAGGFFLLLSPTSASLFISTAIIGVCTGAITSIAVHLTKELFGGQNFSVNHNVVVANISVGSLIFGYLSAVVYHKEGSHDDKCMGTACYALTFAIWGVLCIVGIGLATVMYARTRRVYSPTTEPTRV